MEFIVKPLDAVKALVTEKTGCIAVGVYQQKQLSPAASTLDVRGVLGAAVNSGDISGKVGSTLLLRDVAGVAAERVLLVGLGEPQDMTQTRYEKVLQATLSVFGTLGCDDAVIALPCDGIVGRDQAWMVGRVVALARQARYRSDGLMSKSELAPAGVRAITIMAPNIKSNRAALIHAAASADGVELARCLGDMPPNLCTPAYLASVAVQLGKQFGFEVDILAEPDLQALKMESFLAVAKGSAVPPRLIVLKHLGGKEKEAPVVLVGKGITFDSGGISMKPATNMDEMKYDMGGAAAVLGVFRAVGALQLKRNVIGVIAACENMPSGQATRPGDVITSMSGQTIEVLNTDAEGRLVLCDALTYVERFKPAAVIDIATLTGACVVALGHHNSGLFSRHEEDHDELADALLAAGRQVEDTAWRLPIEAAYGEQLKSNFADLANIGSPGGGAVVAAAFLEHFTRKYIWAHLDIAGTAWKSGADKGATGRPVPLLVQFLLNRK